MHARYACCHRVPPAASLFRNRPPFPRRSFLTIAFFFLSLLLDRTERAFAPGTRLLPDREAIDRARARWLPSKGQPNGPTWRDRISIFYRARLRITCPCAPHAMRLLRTSTSLCAWRLENYMLCDVWILRREQFLLLAGASCEVKTRDEERNLPRLIYHSEYFLRGLEIVSRLRAMKRRYTNDMIDSLV